MPPVAIYSVVEEAEQPPVTIGEVKAELRIDSDDFDDEIERKILVATSEIEEECRLQLISSTWKLVLDRFPLTKDCGVGEIQIEKCPVTSVESIVYVATDGTNTTLSTSNYRVDLTGFPARIHPAYGQAWPSTLPVSNAVTVTFVAGYGAQAVSVPSLAKQVIIFRCREMFEGCDESPFTEQLKSKLKWGDGWRR